MINWSEKIYASYKQMCKNTKKDPVSKKSFGDTFKKQQRVLSYMIKIGRSLPWIIDTIDDTFLLHAEIHEQRVSVNILTKDEVKAFGIKEVGGKKRSSI